MSSINRIIDTPSPPPKLPYNPSRRTPAYSVLTPLSQRDLQACANCLNPLRGHRSTSQSSSTPVSNPISAQSSSNTGSHPLPKRPRSPELQQQYPSSRKRPNVDVATVESHYNARPNIAREDRLASPIIALKNFNNWIKSVLIAKYARPTPTAGPSGIKVLDLGCGKGGDLQKWSKAGVGEYVGIDLAAVSVAQAKQRHSEMNGRKFAGQFFSGDCFESPLVDFLGPDVLDRPFDVVSMQFCMHYAFETEEKVRMMLRNVSDSLITGGTFIGTIPDSQNLLARIEAIPQGDELEFGNEVYKVKFDEADLQPRYGHRYSFFLEDAVEEVPEYVVHWDEFVELASAYGLAIVYCEPFHEIFESQRAVREFSILLERMKVVDQNGATQMTMAQWEAANLYLGFSFVKIEIQE